NQRSSDIGDRCPSGPRELLENCRKQSWRLSSLRWRIFPVQLISLQKLNDNSGLALRMSSFQPLLFG
ncbi:MAG: hypothetical protein ACR2PB_04985, partial [Desulfocapsaceae bacterium]